MSEAVTISFEGGAATIDASLVAEGLRLQPEAVPKMLQDGSITGCLEQGVGEDEGRFRLTFWYGSLRFRIIVDKSGRVLQRLRLDHGRPRPIRSSRR